MTLVKFTTSTGSEYVIGGGLVRKNGDASKLGEVWATPDWHEAQQAEEQFTAPEWATQHGAQRMPTVGECLFVTYLWGWYLSTPIVSVEEIENQYSRARGERRA